MSSFPQYLVPACISLLLVGTASIDAVPTGFVEGHLKIISPKEVELADETPSKITAENYADSGDYVLDVRDRRRRHVRAAPQPFTVASNQTVHVDMNIDTGVR